MGNGDSFTQRLRSEIGCVLSIQSALWYERALTCLLMRILKYGHGLRTASRRRMQNTNFHSTSLFIREIAIRAPRYVKRSILFQIIPISP